MDFTLLKAKHNIALLHLLDVQRPSSDVYHF
jgi:hypothetical protein